MQARMGMKTAAAVSIAESIPETWIIPDPTMPGLGDIGALAQYRSVKAYRRCFLAVPTPGVPQVCALPDIRELTNVDGAYLGRLRIGRSGEERPGLGRGSLAKQDNRRARSVVIRFNRMFHVEH